MESEQLISSKHLADLHKRFGVKRYVIPTDGQSSPHVLISYRRLVAWLRESPGRWGFVKINTDLFDDTTAEIIALHCPTGGRSTI